MPNEVILILSVLFLFGSVLLAYRMFSKSGLYAMTVIATVFSNIEVLILVHAFGMEQTLGNVLFASTFLITDILSENEGKKAANLAVSLGIFISAFSIVLTQGWFLYTPSEADWVMPSVQTIFTNTPRTMLASLLAYVISQYFDVWLYHKWWSVTTRRFGDSKRFLWLRNNGSTLVSQIVNTLVFTVVAFWGMYSAFTVLSLFLSTYVIYIFTSLLDTPCVYIARIIKTKWLNRKEQAASGQA